jgi:hypothetical protein
MRRSCQEGIILSHGETFRPIPGTVSAALCPEISLSVTGEGGIEEERIWACLQVRILSVSGWSSKGWSSLVGLSTRWNNKTRVLKYVATGSCNTRECSLKSENWCKLDKYSSFSRVLKATCNLHVASLLYTILNLFLTCRRQVHLRHVTSA